MNAADLVNPITPCLDTVYALPEALPRSPASDETLTIDPLPRCSMVGRTARVTLKPPVRLIAMTRPPSRAMRDAVARPIPEAAPVTITVLPVNRTAVSCSFQPVSGSSVGMTPPFTWTTRSSMTDCGS
jgi:hypothetical protein